MTDLLFKSIHIKIDAGDSKKLKATIFPREAANKNINFTTSNPGIVNVDNDGNITAVKSGMAVITATSAENSSITDKCTVVVKSDVDRDEKKLDDERKKQGMTVFKEKKTLNLNIFNNFLNNRQKKSMKRVQKIKDITEKEKQSNEPVELLESVNAQVKRIVISSASLRFI